MGAAEDRVAQELPQPKIEYETHNDGDGGYPAPTAASYDQQEAWALAREQIFAERWSTSCAASCSASLEPKPAADADFCEDWTRHYPRWARLSAPSKPGEQAFTPEFLGHDAELLSAMAAMTWGTTTRLIGAADSAPGPQARALQSMIADAGAAMLGAESCVPGLSESGQPFVIALELGPQGKVQAAKVREGSASAGDCVAKQLARALVLPARVAREFPLLEVGVHVRKPIGAGGLDVFRDDLELGAGGLGRRGGSIPAGDSSDRQGVGSFGRPRP